MKCLNVIAIEDIILVDVLDFKKPERAGDHCRALATRAAEKIAKVVHLPAPNPATENAVEIASLVRFSVVDTLKKSAPGISETMREAIANSVVIKVRSQLAPSTVSKGEL